MANISFGTFNLYNLQLPGKPWRGSTPYTQDEYKAKVKWSAGALRRMECDVIGFQELWSKQCLIDVFEAAKLSDHYELLFIKDAWYDIAVAAAVRKPWSATIRGKHKGFPPSFVLKKRPHHGGIEDEDDDIEVNIDRFSRTILELGVTHSDNPDVPQISVFIGHLKSKLATRLDVEERRVDEVRMHAAALGAALSTIRRTAEAAALRVILNERLRDSKLPVVVIGDLNDGQMSNTLGILTEQPAYRLFEASRAGGASDRGLYTVATLQQYRSLRDVYYTHEHKGVREILDHVLISEQFYDHSKNRKWSFEEAQIWNDHMTEEDSASSDHGIVAARFRWA